MNFLAQDTRIELPLGSTEFHSDSEENPNINFEAAPPSRFLLDIKAATLTVHLPKGDSASTKRPVVVICPGGGYVGLCIDKEGHFLASYLNRHGIVAAVLKYRIPVKEKKSWPLPFEDTMLALAMLKEHSEEWALALDRLALMGFSAGGHLAGSVGLRFDEIRGSRDFPCPTHLALVYPVTSASRTDTEKAMDGLFRQLLGDADTPENRVAHSLENHVTPASPALFLAHAQDDPVVPLWHSEVLYDAARKNNVPVELRVHPTGGHGFDGAGTCEHVAIWLDRFIEWFKSCKRS